MKKPSERIAEIAKVMLLHEREAVILGPAAIIAYLDEQAAPKLKFCPDCQKQGTRSSIRLIDSASYAVNVRGGRYWDEDGVYHAGSRQPGYETFMCSNGHSWREEHQ